MKLIISVMFVVSSQVRDETDGSITAIHSLFNVFGCYFLKFMTNIM